MADVSKINFGDGVERNVKDATARSDLASKESLKLATSGTTANGEIRFGVSGTDYGYIAPGSSSVTPFSSGGGGGTTVIANPVGTPTDDLDTVQIGNTIYNIAGGGGYLPAIYSEQEREVGVWTDGKPLYQKTFISVPQSTSYNIDVSGLNIDKLVLRQGTITRDVGGGSYQQKNIEYRTESASYNAYGFGVELRDTDLAIDLYSYSYAQITEIRITIQYTKTTDTAGSGTWTPEGQYSHVYSTNPHIVGKWIDGSAIWECTYDLGSDVTVSTNWSATTIPNTDMDMCIRCEAMSSYGTNKPNIEADLKDSGGYVKLAADGVSNNVRYLTLQYTMST